MASLFYKSEEDIHYSDFTMVKGIRFYVVSNKTFNHHTIMVT